MPVTLVRGMDTVEVPTAPGVLRMTSESGGLTTPFGASIGTLSAGSLADLSLVSWKSLSEPCLDPPIPAVEAMLRERAVQVAMPLTPDELRRRDLARDVLPHLRDFHAGHLDGEERTPFQSYRSRR